MAKVENLSFDPWGRRRNPTTWTYTNVPSSFVFDRGYTGHEHLDKFGLINMNGRIYDPTLARFLSPDPILQNPGYTQSHNRYSYCLNNPLKYTDPSGYSYKPDDWNKFGGVVSMTFGFGAGLSGRLGPGSGNHWSDAYRNEAGNYMLMSSSTFNNMYGAGASDIGYALLSNSLSSSNFRQGMISISSVRQAGGYWTSETSVTVSPNVVYFNDGTSITLDFTSTPDIINRWNKVSGPNYSDRFGSLDFMGLAIDIVEFAANQAAKEVEQCAQVVNGVIKSAAQITAENRIIFTKLVKGASGVGGAVGVIDCSMQAYSDFSNGDYGLGAYETAKSLSYLTGTVLLFTPLAPIGAGILFVTGAVDITGDVGLYVYGRNR